jgi:hypothetical protein
MCIDIKGVLKNKFGKKSLKGFFTDENDRPCSHDAAVDYLTDCLSKGWKVLPMGECDNFDYQAGCQGHKPIESSNTTT